MATVYHIEHGKIPHATKKNTEMLYLSFSSIRSQEMNEKMPMGIMKKAETDKILHGFAELGVTTTSDSNIRGVLGNHSFLHVDHEDNNYSTSKQDGRPVLYKGNS